MADDLSIQELKAKLITASHILHYHHVCDAYGHISFRNPLDRDTFFMPRNLAPALVSSQDDIVEYSISSAESVVEDAPKGYLERNIHAGVYRQYSEVNSVVHAHAEAVVTFSILPEGIFKPVLHMAGFLGSKTPTFDISPFYSPSDQQDLLVRTVPQGDVLSSFFSSPLSSDHKPTPDHSVVLMRGHGFTVAAPSIEAAVYQANYTKTNAEILSKALAASGGIGFASDARSVMKDDEATYPRAMVQHLTGREAEDTWKGISKTVERPWALWSKEVEVQGEKGGLYSNKVKDQLQG